MRNQRNKRIQFKKGAKYTIRRLAVLIVLCILLFLLASVLFKGNTNTNIIANENSSGNNADISDESDKKENSNEDDTSKEKPKEDITLNMAVTGDIMCHNTMYQDAYNSSDKTYDFSYMFDDILLPLQTADITVGNLETTFAGSSVGYSGYPTFNTPEILAKNLKSRFWCCIYC